MESLDIVCDSCGVYLGTIVNEKIKINGNTQGMTFTCQCQEPVVPDESDVEIISDIIG